jgi:hypothetical protein
LAGDDTIIMRQLNQPSHLRGADEKLLQAVMDAVRRAVGRDRLGVRVSPQNTQNDVDVGKVRIIETGPRALKG